MISKNNWLQMTYATTKTHQIPPPLLLGVADDLTPAPIPELLGVCGTATPPILGVRDTASCMIFSALSRSILHRVRLNPAQIYVGGRRTLTARAV